MSEKQFYSKEYWYDSPEEHSDVDNYGKNYYGYQILEKVVLQSCLAQTDVLHLIYCAITLAEIDVLVMTYIIQSDMSA